MISKQFFPFKFQVIQVLWLVNRLITGCFGIQLRKDAIVCSVSSKI